MTVKLVVHQTADDFLQVTRAALEENEITNGLMLGVALRIQSAPDAMSTPPYLATVSDEAGLILAALMTPPFPLTLFRHRPDTSEAYELITQDLLAAHSPVHSVSGRVPLPLEFATVWVEHTGGTYTVNVHLRLYELRQVLPTQPVPGQLRLATMDDLDLVAEWGEAFTREALPENDASQARTIAQRKVSQGEVFLWEDSGRPVSMVAKTRPLRKSITIGYVYTPPALRRRGYATQAVTTLSQNLLAAGWQSCTLFTDLANPTSNSIYQKIGYQPMCDYDEYQLG